MSADRCSRCGGRVECTVKYSTSTARWVERTCARDARALKRQHGRLVKVSAVNIPAPS